MIVNPFTGSPLLQTLLGLIIFLAAFSVIGLVLPLFRGRGYEDNGVSGTLGKGYQYFYGTKETLEKLKNFKEAGEFSEGAILGYKALRNLLPKVNLLSENKANTELDIISEMIRTSPELRGIAQPILQSYTYYERARFSKPLTSEELDDAITAFDRVYSHSTIKRKRG
ncbi:MAG: hypothetical protein FJ358_06445 [Thaumarchaeota archaeon]|nr:hypothetical protein [Nitrososphaerota archaeon]